jgi:hypothetical protein
LKVSKNFLSKLLLIYKTFDIDTTEKKTGEESMSSHSWYDQCRFCGFENMLVSNYSGIYFEVICPICGYTRWTEERIPQVEDIELAKQRLREMNVEERENMIELYYEDNVSLISRLKYEPPNQE